MDLEIFEELFRKYELKVRKDENYILNGKQHTLFMFERLQDSFGVSLTEEKLKDILNGFMEAFLNLHVLPALEEAESRCNDIIGSDYKELIRKGDIIPVAVNTEANQKLLVSVPHREAMDLSIVYRVVVTADDNGITTFLLSNDMVHAAGVTEDDLYARALQYAVENIRVESIESRISDILGIEEPFEFPSDKAMLIISNKAERYGAGVLALLALEDAMTFNIDFSSPVYILPLSVDEIIVLNSTEEPDFTMVKKINSDQLEAEGCLSNSVYRLNPETGKAEMIYQGAPLAECD